MISTVAMLLVCLSSVVRADGLVDESSVAAMVKAMREEMREQTSKQEQQTSKQEQQIVKLKDTIEIMKQEEGARKAKTEPTHVQLTTGGEVVELVSAAGFKGLAERVDAAEERVVAAEERAKEKNAAQDAEIGTIVTTVSKLREELKTGRAPSGEGGDQLARELDAAKATLATQQAQISELSATVAQLLATPQARPMPVADAAETAAARRLKEAGSSSPLPPPAPWHAPLPCATGCADMQPSSYVLPSKLLELKASGITGSVGGAIGTWSDTSGNRNHASSSGTVSNVYAASPVLVEHTDSQGSVHKVARFGCSNCASAAPTWGSVTPLQTSQYVFSTQSAGLEAWAVVRQPDTGDVSDDFGYDRFLFDFGFTQDRGYGLLYAAGRVQGYTATQYGGKADGAGTTLTRALTIVRMRVVFGSGGVMRLEQNGQLVKSASTNLPGLTANEIDESTEDEANSGPFLIGSQSKSANRGSRFFKGEMAELTLYDGLLSDNAAAQQLAQLATLYGITIPDSNYAHHPNCATQLAKSSQCEERRLGTNSDGYCALTCGVCSVCPPPPSPPAWPPLPATANELRISGRHTAISFNTNVHGVEPFRCVAVGDGKLTCSAELRATDFRTASGISLEELAQFAGMVPPSAPPPSPPPPPPSPPPPMRWRVSNAGDLTWRPGVNLAFFGDVACTASIAIPADGGWPDAASACPSTGCALCSGWIGPVGTRGCHLAYDGNPSTTWRPGGESYSPTGEVWMEIRFASDPGIACVKASNIGEGEGGGNSWNGGLTVQTSVDDGANYVTRERDEGAANNLDANYFPLVPSN
eukprot:scaffold25299_cov63-Phaeocystis_antarctica.AAC.2